MPSQTVNYQCPACTGPLHFDGAKGKLACDYCGSIFSVKEIEELYGDKTENAAAAAAQESESTPAPENTAEDEFGGEETAWDYSETEQWNDSGLKTYNCTSCGAELICDDTTAATACPYCGNPTIIPGNLSGVLKPEFIIPFKLDKNAAMEALKKHYGGKKLVPRIFISENQVQKVQGIYVPFWLYSGSVDADVTFSGETVDRHRERDYEVTNTHIYNLQRSGSVDFSNIPVDASTKMDDAMMDSIEPFDYDEMVPFSTSYLPGYLADKYDVDAADCSRRADERAANTTVGVLRGTTRGFLNVQELNRRVYIRRGKANYALLPVWLLNTHWNGKDYVFAMNGQTGKMIGDLPMDKSLYWKWFLIYGGAISAAIFALINIL